MKLETNTCKNPPKNVDDLFQHRSNPDDGEVFQDFRDDLYDCPRAILHQMVAPEQAAALLSNPQCQVVRAYLLTQEYAHSRNQDTLFRLKNKEMPFDDGTDLGGFLDPLMLLVKETREIHDGQKEEVFWYVEIEGGSVTMGGLLLPFHQIVPILHETANERSINGSDIHSSPNTETRENLGGRPALEIDPTLFVPPFLYAEYDPEDWEGEEEPNVQETERPLYKRLQALQSKYPQLFPDGIPTLYGNSVRVFLHTVKALTDVFESGNLPTND